MNLVPIVSWDGQPVTGFINTDNVGAFRPGNVLNPFNIRPQFKRDERPFLINVDFAPGPITLPGVTVLFTPDGGFVAYQVEATVALLDATPFPGAPDQTQVVSSIGGPFNVSGDVATIAGQFTAAAGGSADRLVGQYGANVTFSGGATVVLPGGATVVGVNYDVGAVMDTTWNHLAIFTQMEPVGPGPYAADWTYDLPPGTSIAVGTTSSNLTWSNSAEVGLGAPIPDDWSISNLGVPSGGSPGQAQFRITGTTNPGGLITVCIRQTILGLLT